MHRYAAASTCHRTARTRIVRPRQSARSCHVLSSTDCPKNSYQNVKSQGSCINCPAGRWTDGLTKRTSQDDCVPCPENWFSAGERADCQKCPAGQSTLGFTGVTACQSESALLSQSGANGGRA